MIETPTGGLMRDDPKSGFTRRDLVRGAVLGAVAANVPARPAEAQPELGPGTVALELEINGKKERLSVEPRVTLADALRERLSLTGTKTVCGRGACGACTVLVDGETMCSCLLLAVEMPGRRITTIEGLASDGRLSPIQEAFVAADALQCGFCTSGMVVSCKALLDRNPRPTRDQVREAVSGNLCRCGTYPHVFDAVERAAGRAPSRASLTIETLTLAGSGLHSDGRVDAAIAEVEEA
jgi:aerobic-type carbon monoxide dehydrogenase small subunit (CoxS/CutS family)